jgi:hypothetical protein
MIDIKNNRITCNNGVNGLIQVTDGNGKFSGGIIRVKAEATNTDCTISDCIFEPRDNDWIGVEFREDGVHLFYEEGNGKTNEFIGYAIVPTKKFVWMESQMHWHRFKCWLKDKICLLKRKILFGRN